MGIYVHSARPGRTDQCLFPPRRIAHYTNTQSDLYHIQYNAQAATNNGTTATFHATLNTSEITGSSANETFSFANNNDA